MAPDRDSAVYRSDVSAGCPEACHPRPKTSRGERHGDGHHVPGVEYRACNPVGGPARLGQALTTLSPCLSLFCLAIGVAVAGACSETRKEVLSGPVVSRDALRAEAVGCWRLFGRWGASPPEAYWAPAYVQLDTVLAGAVHGGGVRLSHRFGEEWAALPLNMEPGINGLNTWRADRDSDSIRIVFNNMFSGSEFVMLLRSGAARNDTMRGRHSQFSDDMRDPIRSLGTAHAVRVDCRERRGG